MKYRTIITNEQWNYLQPILLQLSIYNKSNLRNTIEGILFRIRTGIPWRDIPNIFGNANTMFKSFRRWTKKGIIKKLFNLVKKDPDLEWLFIDSTTVKAHQNSLGIKDQSIGKSVCGNNSKIHLIVDSHVNPIDFKLSAGNVHDVKIAPDLVSNMDLSNSKFVCADKGYDSDLLRAQIEKSKVRSNIPKKINSITKDHKLNKFIYKSRHLVEQCFARLKQFRAISTRYDKTDNSFESSIFLAFMVIWLKLIV